MNTAIAQLKQWPPTTTTVMGGGILLGWLCYLVTGSVELAIFTLGVFKVICPQDTAAIDMAIDADRKLATAPVAKTLALCLVASLALTACQGPQLAAPQPPDPAVVAKINYVCAYSGAFKFADRLAASVIPVPGVALGVNLVNAGVDRICANPAGVAATEATVVNLIAQFKAAGKM